MAGWKDNALMYWMDGNTLVKVSDHGRSSLSEQVERIEHKSRMADGTLRRYSIAKKRSWSCSWDMLPSTNTAGGLRTVDGGMSGRDLESFHNRIDGSFRMVLRRGAARDKALPVVADSALPYQDENYYIVKVMITDFSKDVVKRGPKSDLWTVDITLEEV